MVAIAIIRIIFSKGCPSCESEQREGAEVCTQCGNALTPQPPWAR